MLRSATESNLARILRTLGNEDSIKILRLAEKGFDGSTDIHQRLGLSIKRYYWRLKGLMDADLIHKTNNRYELTPLGLIISDTFERRLVWAVENMGTLKVIETLKTSKDVDEADWKPVIANILGNESITDLGIFGRPISTYEALVDATVDLTERALRNVHLVTRYGDIRAIEAGWRAIERGVTLKVIDGVHGAMSGRMKVLQTLIAHPKYVKMFYQLWHSDKVQFRYREVPFSFMVVDERDCCLEILNPAINGFFTAVEFDNNRTICGKLIETFDNLWEQGAKEDPILGITEDLVKGVQDDSTVR